MVLGVEVLLFWVFMISGLSEVGAGVSTSLSPLVSDAGSWNGGMVLPRMGVSPLVSSFLLMTSIGVLSTTTSPPSTQPGDLGSISARVFTGVSQFSAAAMGVLVTSSLADRGSDVGNIKFLCLSMIIMTMTHLLCL